MPLGATAFGIEHRRAPTVRSGHWERVAAWHLGMDQGVRRRVATRRRSARRLQGVAPGFYTRCGLNAAHRVDRHQTEVVMTSAVESAMEIRPFHVDVPDEVLDDLRRRIGATRWPSEELVVDRSQGVQLATVQELARYWATDYDWRACEARLNALPQFKTEIDGVDIHFIHVKSPEADALPLIMTHGWPGSVIELLEVVGPLTDPTSHGGTPGDAFHLVLPSLPGYGPVRHIQAERLRLLPGDGHAAADDRLCPPGFTRCLGGLAPRPRHGQLLQDLPRLRRRRTCRQSHPGPHRRQHHAVLADGHRHVGGPVLLGGRTSPGSSTSVGPGSSGGLAPGRLHHLPRRDLADPAQLGRELLPQRDLLQRGRQGRPLRRLGRARPLRKRDASCLQLTALIRQNGAAYAGRSRWPSERQP